MKCRQWVFDTEEWTGADETSVDNSLSCMNSIGIQFAAKHFDILSLYIEP